MFETILVIICIILAFTLIKKYGDKYENHKLKARVEELEIHVDATEALLKNERKEFNAYKDGYSRELRDLERKISELERQKENWHYHFNEQERYEAHLKLLTENMEQIYNSVQLEALKNLYHKQDNFNPKKYLENKGMLFLNNSDHY